MRPDLTLAMPDAGIDPTSIALRQALGALRDRLDAHLDELVLVDAPSTLTMLIAEVTSAVSAAAARAIDERPVDVLRSMTASLSPEPPPPLASFRQPA